MKYGQFKISADKKDFFNSKFSKLFALDIEKFSSYGEQPLMTWSDFDSMLEISTDFLDKLPAIAKADLQQLIDNSR